MSSGSLWGEYRVVVDSGRSRPRLVCFARALFGDGGEAKASLFFWKQNSLMGRSRRLPKKQLSVRRCHTRGSIFCAWGSRTNSLAVRVCLILLVSQAAAHPACRPVETLGVTLLQVRSIVEAGGLERRGLGSNCQATGVLDWKPRI